MTRSNHLSSDCSYMCLGVSSGVRRRRVAEAKRDCPSPQRAYKEGGVGSGGHGARQEDAVGSLLPGRGDDDTPAAHLSWGDVAIDNPTVPSVLRVTIKQSKTDPFRKGVLFGKTGTDVCPVMALLGYMVARGSQDGPLFMFKDGRYLTRQRLVEALREALAEAGLDQTIKVLWPQLPHRGSYYSSREGDRGIQTLGRWKSLAYLQIPRDQLANYSRMLCT